MTASKSEYTIGHSWQPRRHIIPALLSATEVRGPYPGVLNKVRASAWILDYEFTAHGKWKITTRRMPWRERRASTVHLYAPNVPVVEDTRFLSGIRHSAWLLLSGGTETGLEKMLDRNKEFAEFVDAEGICGEEFHKIAAVASDRGEAGFAKAQSCLWSLLNILLDAEPIEDGIWRIQDVSHAQKQLSLSARVDAILENPEWKRPSLKFVAQKMHMSVSHLSHTYRRETGIAPITAWRQRRVRQAALLATKGLPLKAIAEQVGFSDAFHLSKVFKKIMGVSPRRYLALAVQARPPITCSRRETK